MTAYTVYPQGWFHRTARAKQHAVLLDKPPFRSQFGAALCGTRGVYSENEFKEKHANVITCARCVALVAKSRNEVMV